MGNEILPSAGLTYSGERFETYFKDFADKYGIRDMYSGGFYPFASLEEYWAWWSRHIIVNRTAGDKLRGYFHIPLLCEHTVYRFLIVIGALMAWLRTLPQAIVPLGVEQPLFIKARKLELMVYIRCQNKVVLTLHQLQQKSSGI